jgi:hypothetical protein
MEVIMKAQKLLGTFIFIQCMAVIAASAQITYISSTSKPTGAFLPVGSDMWRAQGFFTGANPLGYQLDSISLLMGNASGAPNGFNVSLYSYTNELFPGEQLWTLEGSSDPSSSGVYSFSGTDITLLRSTSYYIVFSADQPLATGSYSPGSPAPAVGSVYDRVDGWGIGHWVNSLDGLEWERAASQSLQFDISATAIIPEPSHLALVFGACALLVAVRLRKR